MSSLKIFNITLVRKYLMAVTGLFLSAFLIEHLYGNILLLYNDGGVAFNQYCEDMTGSLLIRIIEFALFGAFLFHIIDAIVISVQNKNARPLDYAVDKKSKNSSWYSRNMGFTGSIIFIFLVLHLRTFFFEHRVLTSSETYYDTLVFAFQHGWYVAFYVVSMILLGAHLNHGIQSAFRSLGLSNKNYSGIIKTTGSAFAILMAVGFAAFPIIFYFNLLGR
jgi:succinate dehydrogenase / fumarate reductase cytochrome b subunit